MTLGKNSSYHTDKFESGLIKEYLRLLPQRSYKIMEVGHLKGEFLRWFKDTFVGSEVYGIDIEPHPAPQGIVHIQANQNDSHALIEIGETLGKFDVIIDDASHDSIATENTFNSLWPYIHKGGWYVIEDWGVCHSPDHRDLGDMRNFLYGLERDRKTFGIKESEIIYRRKWTSIACFRKR